MNIGVIGFGHFASIVAAVMAERGHTVAQSDETPHLVRDSQIAPDAEPGYSELAKAMQEAGRLVTALPSVDVYWIAYDVPLNSSGGPDTSEVTRRTIGLHSRVPNEIPFLVSCQWPVGTTRIVSQQCAGREVIYVMENVRAAKAIADFRARPFPLIGQGDAVLSMNATRLIDTYAPIVSQFVSWESAEMAKHATNAFMALQIAFVNEIAAIADQVKASPDDIADALLSDPRVSPLAPLRAGKPFGGGSLKRDVLVLKRIARQHGVTAPILSSIVKSNETKR